MHATHCGLAHGFAVSMHATHCGLAHGFAVSIAIISPGAK